MAKPLKPIVRSGGYYPSAKYTPLVYPGGYTTLNAKNDKPEPSDPLNTFVGKIVQFLAKRSLPMVKLEANFTPVQDLNGYDAPWPPGGGKNKFDISKMVNTSNITISNGVIAVTGNAKNSGKKLSELANLIVGETYTLTATTDGASGQIYLYGTGANISWMYNGNLTITQAHLDALVFFYGGNSGGVDQTSHITNFMIRLASVSDATFAPYANECPISGHTGCDIFDKAEYDAQATPTVSISFGTTVYSGTLTVNEDGTGTVTATHKGHTFNGSERWDLWNGVFVNYDLTDAKQSDTESSTNKIVIADRFKSNGVTYRASCGDGNIIKVIGANTQVACYSSAFANETAFKASLVNDPMTVVYELATPITIPLTASQISTLVGTNTVWVNDATGDITVQAYGTEIT